MHPFDEMKAWIGFTDDDVAALTRLVPHAAPRFGALADIFYDRILQNPEAAKVFTGSEQVDRLKRTLTVWAHELLVGPYDLAYYERRQRIGQRHVDVGLSTRYMFLAMSVYRQQLWDIARAAFEPELAHRVCEAVAKVCDLDLAVMTSTYVRGREVRQLETLQEVVISHLRTAALVLDTRGMVVAATPSAAPLLAVEDPLGVAWSDALAPTLEAAPSLASVITGALAGREAPPIPRFSLRTDEGIREYRVWAAPLDHAHARVLVQLDDITESIQAEVRAQQAESLAQIGALSAAVAHELRNPLAGISGAIQVIARSMVGDDRRKPIMDKVEQQVRRLDALVSDLLSFARPTAPELATVDLADASRTVAELVGRESPGATVEVHGAGTAMADSALLQQILLNLVQNAIQAQNGGGAVRLDVAPGVVDVCDAGPGVPAESREQIFAPFYTTRAKGTGLGLAICRKHAQAMAGTVTLLDRADPGACFRLTLGEGTLKGGDYRPGGTSPSGTGARSG